MSVAVAFLVGVGSAALFFELRERVLRAKAEREDKE